MLDWHQIDTVLLDMDGVLLNLDFDDHFWLEYVPQRYAAVHGMTLKQARVLLTGWYQQQAGTLNWYCVDYWSRRLGFDIAALKVRQVGRIALHPDTERFLAALRELGKPRILVTNAHPKPLRLKLAATGMGPWLDSVISAFDVGRGKEEAGFWELLQRLVCFDPARTVLLEDSLSNLKTAHDYGIAHLVQITKPNASKAVRPAGPYPWVEGLGELLPGLLIAIDRQD